MNQFEFNNAKVRIHGNADKEKLQTATLQFMKKVRNKKNEKKNQKSTA